jgi:hypothetical protein
LAAQSDAVAEAIEANDGCEAARRVAELRSSLDEPGVPEAIRREVAPLAGRTFTCAPPPPPPPPPAPVSTADEDDDHEDEGKKGKSHKKDKGKKHGHEKDED